MQDRLAFFFLPLCVCTGVLCSYSDIRYHKIKNAHILFFFALTAALYAALFIHGGFFSGRDMLTLLFNFALASAIAVFLYMKNLWAGGDAKLFILFSLLIPRNLHSDILPLSCLVLFANTFLIGLSAVLFILVVHQGRMIVLKSDHKTILRELGLVFLITTCVMWVLYPLPGIISIHNVLFVNFILVYIFYLLFNRFFYKLNRKFIFLLIPAGLLLRFSIKPDFIRRFFGFLKVTIFFYALLYLYKAVMNNKKRGSMVFGRIPFAPFLFIGTLASQTGFLSAAIRFVSLLHK